MKPELKLLSSAVLASGLVFAAGASRAADDPNGWAMYGRGYDNTRYSPLDQINTQNVSGLKLAYAFSLGSLRSNEATPLVVGDTLYVSSSWGPNTSTRWTQRPVRAVEVRTRYSRRCAAVCLPRCG